MSIIIVSTTLYGSEESDIRSADRKGVNVHEMKCLRSFLVVSRLARIRNKKVRR